MIKKYKELFSNTAIFAVSNVLSKFILSLLLPLYTRALTTEMYGKAELITTISDFLIPICSFAIQDALFRYGMENGKRQEEVLKDSILVLGIGTGLLFVASIALRFYEPVGSLYIMFWIVSGVSMWRSAFSLYSKAIEKTVIFAVDSIVYNALLGVFNIIFLFIFKCGLYGYFLSMVSAGISSIAYLAISTNSIRTIFHTEYNFVLLKEMLGYSTPLVFNSISWGLTHIVDKLMLTNLCGSSANGIYSAASKIPALLSLVTGIFTQAWMLSAIKDYQSDRDKRFYSNIFDITHISVCAGTLIILLLNNNLFLMVLGGDFADSIRYAPVLLMGSVFLTYSNYYSPIYSAMKKSKQIMYSSICGGIVNFILNVVLIPKMGIMGACLATAVSYAFIAGYRMIDCQIKFPLNIPYYRWILSMIAMIAAAYITVQDKNYILMISIATLAIFFLYRSLILDFISRIIKVIKQ